MGYALAEHHAELFGSLIKAFGSHCFHAIFPSMNDQGSDSEQRRDKLLLRLLRMPPQSRAELAEQVRRAKRKTSRPREKAASIRKREPISGA